MDLEERLNVGHFHRLYSSLGSLTPFSSLSPLGGGDGDDCIEFAFWGGVGVGVGVGICVSVVDVCVGVGGR